MKTGLQGRSVTIEDVRLVLKGAAWINADLSGLAENDDLYAMGLTSHGSVNLMLALEEHFDVMLPETLLCRETFRSLLSIKTAIASMEQGGTPE